uniref:Cupin-like domain-containing protein n=1 Tax=Strombidium rassoulzadegani TaxID=1082188 RepID=A0A7S3FTM2_9SPIT|mmetsp:Transcript_11057/g.18492  ORF Transcript_11057/g.18492 Transcript_11057/m.18492 type:complete len:303 (+) Transcript_11057:277-1185(+)
MTVSFFSQCVRINRPCILEGLAGQWPSVKESWGSDSLKMMELMGADQNVTVYSQHPERQFGKILHDQYSFHKADSKQMAYSDFYELAVKEQKPGQQVVKDARQSKDFVDKVLHLANDLKELEFYHEVSELEGVELYQGSYFMDKPHYERKEQIFCAVEGNMNIVIVPHVNKQEVYAGKVEEDSVYHEEMRTSKLEEVNVSPINFFMPKRKKYPNFNYAIRHMVNLNKGDCIFVPAFNFYQMQGVNLGKGFSMYKDLFDEASYSPKAQAQGDKAMAVVVGLSFQSNSKLLNGFWEAIEKNIIK